MAFRVRTVRDLDEFRSAVAVIGHYFGWEPTAEDAEQYSRLLLAERLHCVFDGSTIVAGAGVLPLELTIPGGLATCAGVTVVGVLPSHRRRGLLTRLMRAQLLDVRERGEPLAALWASEETIYGRYGYGLSSLVLKAAAKRQTAGLRADLSPRAGRMRLIDHDEALRVLPPLYDKIRRRTVGFLGRHRDWWELRTLDDRPERRRGAGPLNRALLEIDGRPAGYAIYRIKQEGSGTSSWHKTVRVLAAFGVDRVATREIWRFLLEIDWTDEVEAWLLPLDHPLLQLTARVNELQANVLDGLWMRLVDVGAALEARAYASDGRVTLEVTADPLFPENVGCWTIDGGGVHRSPRRPDVRLDVQALASAYLGGFTFAQLAAGERVEEAKRNGLARADALFATPTAPWCPENF
jgi:predicted acetyltransferase